MDMKALLIAAAAGLAANGMDAVDRTLTLNNSSEQAVTGFFVTPDAMDASTINMAPAAGIAPLDTLNITIPSATGACVFDLKIVFADGTEDIRPDVDFCNTDGYIFE